jgi:hypothetical protein
VLSLKLDLAPFRFGITGIGKRKGKVRDLSSASVVNRLPSTSPWALAEGTTQFPDDMRGATLLQIGALADRTLVEGGGLVIDYRPVASTERIRLVLGFTELGAWVEYLGPVVIDPTLDERQ